MQNDRTVDLAAVVTDTRLFLHDNSFVSEGAAVFDRTIDAQKTEFAGCVPEATIDIVLLRPACMIGWILFPGTCTPYRG